MPEFVPVIRRDVHCRASAPPHVLYMEIGRITRYIGASAGQRRTRRTSITSMRRPDARGGIDEVQVLACLCGKRCRDVHILLQRATSSRFTHA